MTPPPMRFGTVLATSLFVAGTLAVVAPRLRATPRPADDERPAIFADLSLEQAREQAGEDGLVIVFLTASWCPPCKLMNRTTWVDEEMVDALRERAVVVALDIDTDPDARRFPTPGVPTMVVERAGQELDRHLGALSSEQLLGWIEGVEQGRTYDEMELERVDAQLEALRNSPGMVNVKERYGLAQQLLRMGRHDEALEEYIWLWVHMLEQAPAMAGVRLSYMASDMKTLAELHLPARAAFRTLCGAAQAKVEAGEADDTQVLEWSVLCDVVGEPERMVDWYERTREEDGNMPGLSGVVRDKLVDLLLEENRALEAGRLVTDPVAVADRQCDMLRALRAYAEAEDNDAGRQVLEFSEVTTRSEVAKLAALMLLAGRADEAEDVADVLLAELDDAATRVALVEATIDWDAPLLPRHLEWLDEIIAASEADAAARSGAEAEADGPGPLDRLLGLLHPDAVARARRLRPQVAERLGR